MVTFLCALVLGPKSFVDLRVNGRILTDNSRPADVVARMWVNGRPTRYLFSSRAYAVVDVLTRKGRMAWSVVWYEGEPMTSRAECFTNVRGRIERLPFGATSIDQRGRIVGITGQDPMWGDPFEPCEGWIWSNGRASKLGPADNLRFCPDGSIQGYVATDGTGKLIDEKAYLLQVGDRVDVRYRPFVLRDGRRTDDLPAAWKPW